MPLDDDLLRAARAALRRLHDARHQVEIATAEFHHALRRLNVNGASRREIAAAFELSHQRVDQIVGSGGRFRDRVTARLRGRAVRACSFCPPEATDPAAPLVLGPAVAICERCIARMPDVAGPAEPMSRCSFCYQSAQPGVSALHGGTEEAVCDQCLALAREIQSDADDPNPEDDRP
jgi:hypothetical protein